MIILWNFCNFILQKHNKSTCNNNCSIRLPWIKSELIEQSFCFYGGQLYKKLPIGIRKLDTISEFKVALRGHFLRYSYLAIFHGYMFCISTPIFFGLSFFLSYIPYLLLFRSHYFHSVICVHTVFQAHGLL